MNLTNSQEAGRPVSVQTREEAHAGLADKFAEWGWTPEAMRAAERTFSPESPVADLMESRASGRQGEADGLEAGT